MQSDPQPDSVDDPGEADPGPVAWSQLAQDMAVTLWPSFLAASVATMFFFAFFDPSVFGEGAMPPNWLTHKMAGYAVGFFFFWAICTLSSALTLYLVRTARPQPRGPGG
ncbi:MAG: putative transrane protein [Proteobacteria bacterium]|nr:putative transrane protein [Pseudomonadota bacterium]